MEAKCFYNESQTSSHGSEDTHVSVVSEDGLTNTRKARRRGSADTIGSMPCGKLRKLIFMNANIVFIG